MHLGNLEVRVAADDIRLAPVSQAEADRAGLDLARVRAPCRARCRSSRVGRGGHGAGADVEGAGRAVDVARVSGDVTVQGLALAQAGAPAPFAQVPRLAVRIGEADAIERRVVIASLEVDGLDVKAVRDAGGKVDLLAALDRMRARAAATPDAPAPGAAVAPAAAPAVPAGAPASSGAPPDGANDSGAPTRPRAPPPDTAAPAASPGPPASSPTRAASSPGPAWHVRIEKVAIRSATGTLTDEMVAPAIDWRVEGLPVDASALDTAAKDARGTLAVTTDLLASSAPSMRAQVTVDASAIGLAPLTAIGRVSVKGFDEISTNLYVPIGMPAAVTAGIIDVEADVSVALPARSGAPGEAAGAAPAIVVACRASPWAPGG
jgi:hypothetical protein